MLAKPPKPATSNSIELGDAFVDAYGATRVAEADAFDRWFRSRITDWELARYLEAF